MLSITCLHHFFCTQVLLEKSKNSHLFSHEPCSGLWYVSIKVTSICGNHFRYCAASLLQTQLRKTQTQLWRIHKQTTPHFRNVCVCEPIALWKKPSVSLEETFQFLEEAFQFAAQLHHKHISEKCSECRCHFFLTCTIYWLLHDC